MGERDCCSIRCKVEFWMATWPLSSQQEEFLQLDDLADLTPQWPADAETNVQVAYEKKLAVNPTEGAARAYLKVVSGRTWPGGLGCALPGTSSDVWTRLSR